MVSYTFKTVNWIEPVTVLMLQVPTELTEQLLKLDVGRRDVRGLTYNSVLCHPI